MEKDTSLEKNRNAANTDPNNTDSLFEGRDQYFIDIDRMVNEGLGGGQVTIHNGLIDSDPEIENESPPTNDD